MRNTLMIIAGLLLAACSHDRPPPQTPSTTSAIIARQAPELQPPGTVGPASAATMAPDLPPSGGMTDAPSASPLDPIETWNLPPSRPVPIRNVNPPAPPPQ